MPIARDIKRRIRSVKSTQQITRAMKMVAAAKLRRAQERMLAMRPYAEQLDATLRYLAVDLVGDEHPLFARREPRRVINVVIAGDRGLCGGFNTNILRAAKQQVSSLPGVEHQFFAIGKRVIAGLRREAYTIRKAYHDVFEKLSYILSQDICAQLVHLNNCGGEEQIDEVYIIFNEFVSVMTQRPVVKKLLPLDFDALFRERQEELKAEDAGDKPRPIYEIEPDVESAVADLVARKLATDLYRATLESYAAELAARMTAMDSATNNAGEMIERLTLEYNRARQAGITAELLDIVGGSSALA